MLRVGIIKPSKYGVTGGVERFRRGFMPNSTVQYMRSMTPGSTGGLAAYLGHPIFSRYAAAKRMHPMSGGVGRVRVDSFANYRHLRRKQFGFEQVPLPKSLELSKADAELNRRVKIAI